MESKENAQRQANPLDHRPGVEPEEMELKSKQILFLWFTNRTQGGKVFLNKPRGYAMRVS